MLDPVLIENYFTNTNSAACPITYSIVDMSAALLTG
jgi:hypothetical protein